VSGSVLGTPPTRPNILRSGPPGVVFRARSWSRTTVLAHPVPPSVTSCAPERYGVSLPWPPQVHRSPVSCRYPHRGAGWGGVVFALVDGPKLRQRGSNHPRPTSSDVPGLHDLGYVEDGLWNG
jgi:hypothetical protein